jgi:hypothetical protein
VPSLPLPGPPWRTGPIGRLADGPADGACTQPIETADTLFVTAAALGDLLAAVRATAATELRAASPPSTGDALIAQSLVPLPPASADLRQVQACQARWIATPEEAAAALPITVVMMAVVPVHYGQLVFLLTPWIVLNKDIDQPGNWGLALWRIGNSLIGMALSLAAIHLP